MTTAVCHPPQLYDANKRLFAYDTKEHEGLYFQMRADGSWVWKYRTKRNSTDRIANGSKGSRLMPLPNVPVSASPEVAIPVWKELSGKAEQGKKVVSSGAHTATDVWVELEKLTLDALARGERRRSTYTNDEISWRLHLEPTIGNKIFARITSEEWAEVVKTWRAKKLGGNTQLNIKKVVNKMYRVAKRKGWAFENTYADLLTEERPKKNKPKPTIIRPSQTMLMIKAVNPIYRLQLIVLACTGLRISELCGLRWCDIDWENEVLWVNGQLAREAEKPRRLFWDPVPKTDTTSFRSVVLLPLCLRALKEQRKREAAKALASGRTLNDTDFVFTVNAVGWKPTQKELGISTGYPVSQENFRNRGVIAAGELVGLGHIKPHDLRHTTASMLAQAGISTASAAKMMGHTERTYIDIYSHAYTDKTEWDLIRTKLAAVDFGADDVELAL